MKNIPECGVATTYSILLLILEFIPVYRHNITAIVVESGVRHHNPSVPVLVRFVLLDL